VILIASILGPCYGFKFDHTIPPPLAFETVNLLIITYRLLSRTINALLIYVVVNYLGFLEPLFFLVKFRAHILCGDLITKRQINPEFVCRTQNPSSVPLYQIYKPAVQLHINGSVVNQPRRQMTRCGRSPR